MGVGGGGGPLDHLRGVFEDQGITPADFPTAFAIHELLAVAFLASTWAICYQTQPSQSALFAPLARAIRTSENRWVMGVREGFAGVVASAEAKIAASPRLSSQGWDTARLTTALAESTIFRKSIKPITIPGKLWATWKIMELLPWRQSRMAPAKGESPVTANTEQLTQPAAATREARTSRGRKGTRRRRVTLVTVRSRASVRAAARGATVAAQSR
ncbi:hypothetical protein JKP88DRAFT_349226 [Tribonema minus]|uniref:Uncharacterized protein n=1 Tax=Tribonema minus TaxID=303371 RepID=A0A835Z1Y4_9STRA|nr:hypothetical protein JKP88DRAFT_349226 [Tribonema minus]